MRSHSTGRRFSGPTAVDLVIMSSRRAGELAGAQVNGAGRRAEQPRVFVPLAADAACRRSPVARCSIAEMVVLLSIWLRVWLLLVLLRLLARYSTRQSSASPSSSIRHRRPFHTSHLPHYAT